MSERTTGATDTQIEAAVRRGYWPDDSRDDVKRQIVTGYAEDLVPPDHRILCPDDLAALRRIVGIARAAYRYDGQAMRYHVDKVEDSDFTRIDTLIGYGNG